MADREARGRLGIELPEVYDGISVWQEPDGTYTNRWVSELDRHPAGSRDRALMERRFIAAQRWIDQQVAVDTARGSR